MKILGKKASFVRLVDAKFASMSKDISLKHHNLTFFIKLHCGTLNREQFRSHSSDEQKAKRIEWCNRMMSLASKTC